MKTKVAGTEAWEPDFSISVVARRKDCVKPVVSVAGTDRTRRAGKPGGMSRFCGSGLRDPCDVIVMFVLVGIS